MFIQTVQDLEKLPRQLPEVGTYTPTGQVLDDLLAAYKRKTGNSPNPLRPKKLMILVVTDGAASKSLDRLVRAYTQHL